MKDVIVVGGGIGGLCTALRLLKEGYKVTILEKESTLGGKVNIKEINGFKFDLTASVLMTPDTYTNLFKDLGRDYRDYIDIKNLDLIYRVNYYDKTYYDIYSDSRKMLNTLESIQEGLSYEYLNFISDSFKKYFISKNDFLDKPMININEVLNFHSIKKLCEIRPLSNCSKYISDKISNDKIRDYLIFKSMYIGVNPYTNSNLYTLIPTVSYLYKLAYIKGGLYEYILSLGRLINEMGGNIKLNSKVEEILVEDEKIIGVKCNNKIYKCDIVVCNADYPYAIKNLFKFDIKEFGYSKENIDNKDYSCSVFMIYLGLNKKYEEIKVHNIYINKSFKEGIEAAFNGEIPKMPSIYMYSPSAIDDTVCPIGCSTLNIMVRVPNLYYSNIEWNENIIKSYRNNIINTLKNIKGLEDIESSIVYEDYLTPLDLENKFNAYKGNSFGLSHKLMQTAYKRPHIKSNNISGLYFIGSSTHPGNGVSVIIDGSKVLSEVIINDYK